MRQTSLLAELIEENAQVAAAKAAKTYKVPVYRCALVREGMVDAEPYRSSEMVAETGRKIRIVERDVSETVQFARRGERWRAGPSATRANDRRVRLSGMASSRNPRLASDPPSSRLPPHPRPIRR
jgi:hypothetical protein